MIPMRGFATRSNASAKLRAVTPSPVWKLKRSLELEGVRPAVGRHRESLRNLGNDARARGASLVRIGEELAQVASEIAHDHVRYASAGST